MGAFFGTSRLEGAVLEATLWPDQDVVAKKVGGREDSKESFLPTRRMSNKGVYRLNIILISFSR